MNNVSAHDISPRNERHIHAAVNIADTACAQRLPLLTARVGRAQVKRGRYTAKGFAEKNDSAAVGISALKPPRAQLNVPKDTNTGRAATANTAGHGIWNAEKTA